MVNDQVWNDIDQKQCSTCSHTPMRGITHCFCVRRMVACGETDVAEFGGMVRQSEIAEFGDMVRLKKMARSRAFGLDKEGCVQGK